MCDCDKTDHNQRAIQKLREDIEILKNNLKDTVPDDDGIILKTGENVLLVMYQGLVELMQREIAKIKNCMEDLSTDREN